MDGEEIMQWRGLRLDIRVTRLACGGARQDTSRNGLVMRILNLTQNLTSYTYTSDHSDPICNGMPTSIIYSLT